ncbi:MAG: recombinase family protein [Nocardioidaceae bacterium]
MDEALVYARLSAAREESVSIERQVEACRQYAASRGWRVREAFTDDGVSASKVKPEQRPAWRGLLAEAKRAQPQAVIVWKVDRLARRVLDFLNADRALREHGSGIVAVQDPVDMTTAQGRAFATVLAVFAELEAEGISVRVKAARAALLKAGRRAGGRPPFGWCNVANPDGPGFVLAPDGKRIAYVVEAAERATRGDSLYSITRWLDDNAPRRPRARRNGSNWAPASVEAVLRNPALAGLTPYQPGRKPGDKPNPWAVMRDGDGVPIVDESVAVLSVEERQRLLEALDARREPGSRPQRGKDPALLSGLLTCRSCGSRMHRSTTGQGYESYRCARPGCPHKGNVNRAKIETYVVEQALAERGETRIHTFEAMPDEQGLALLEQALRDAGSALATTDDDAEVERLLSRIATLKARRAEARQGSTTKQLVTPVRGQRTWGQELREATDPAERQRLIREQVASVVVWSVGRSPNVPMPERTKITWVPLDGD